MMSPLVFEIVAFVLGLLFGSFLNVCIARLPRHESLWHPRSHCPHCGKTIRWYDNIPVLSWILLRGKCRDCQESISWRYPAVELTTAIWFTLVAAVFNARLLNVLHEQVPAFQTEHLADQSIAGIAALILGFLLIGLLVMDWRTHTLPNAFTTPGIAIGFFLTCCQIIFLGPKEGDVMLHGKNPITSAGSTVDKGNLILTGPEHIVLGWLGSVVAAACLLLLIRFLYQKLRGREGLGLGDVKLIAMIAAFLGFWPAMLSLFVGVVLCSVYALTLLLRGKANATSRLPLGSFLCIGGLLAALFGAPLIAWYTSLL
jgi:leader peptidase (prepilin peptidase)/N-methyltransferase